MYRSSFVSAASPFRARLIVPFCVRADCVTTVAEPLTAVAAFAPSREPVLKCRPDIMRLSGPVWRTEPLRPGMKVRGMATSGSARCATRSDSGAEVTALPSGWSPPHPRGPNCNPFVMQPETLPTPCAASELEWSASEGVSTDDTAETLLVSREEKNAFLTPFPGHKRNK